MAVVCRELKLLYLMTPRTGSSAVGFILVERLGGEFLPKEDLFDAQGELLLPTRHNTLRELIKHGATTAEEAAGWLKVASVRNPFDSIVSLYTKRRNTKELPEGIKSWSLGERRFLREVKRAQKCSFTQWVLRTYWPRVILGLLRINKKGQLAKYAEGSDMIIRMEHLQEDFDAVMKRVGVEEEVRVLKQNMTQGRESDYRSYYTPFARFLVRTAFGRDLQRFGYEF